MIYKGKYNKCIEVSADTGPCRPIAFLLCFVMHEIDGLLGRPWAEGTTPKVYFKKILPHRDPVSVA